MVGEYREEDAESALGAWGSFGSDLALRVYTSRLIGADPLLVLHGGGNTSVKTRELDVTGEPIDVLRVKGSGYDLSNLVPEGLTALDLGALRRLQTRTAMTDTEMVATLEALKLQPSAPFPSVEALLHAWIPAKFVDHTHAKAVLVLTNQPSGRQLIESALGRHFEIIDYVMPGFALAAAARDALAGRNDLHGLVCRHHGIFTWGETAKESYDRMIAAVNACHALWEKQRDPSRGCVSVEVVPDDVVQRALAIAPALRGALSPPSNDPDRPHRRVVLTFRGLDESLRAQLDDPRLSQLAERGVLTPDHVIRTKNLPLILPDSRNETVEAFAVRARTSVADYVQRYGQYLQRHRGSRELFVEDPYPRVVLMPGLGLFCAGATKKDASIAADIVEQSLAARFAAEQLGAFAGLDERDVFEVEFWPPEQAKVRRVKRPPLTGRVALVTGAAGAIGAAVSVALAQQGAAVVMADRAGDGQAQRLRVAADRVRAVGAHPLSLEFDVTDRNACDSAIQLMLQEYGGVDLLVLAHGVAEVADIDALSEASMRRSFEVNAFGSFHLIGAVTKLAKLERTGADIVLISTKNVMDPGASFSAYSASKAAAHQLARVAALELAPYDIRVNVVSPDAVFGDEEIPSQLWQSAGAARAASKGIDPATLPEVYRQRSLLKVAVRPAHVAQAVLFFVERRTPTTGAVLPVDAGLPGAFPR